MRRTLLALALLAAGEVAGAQSQQPVNIRDAVTNRRAVVTTNNALQVQCVVGCSGTTTTAGSINANQGAPAAPANAWPVNEYPVPLGTQGNAWNAAAVAPGATSAVVDCLNATIIDIFGNAGSAGTISLQVSQDNSHFYVSDSVTVSAAGDFGFHVQLGSRYARLKSSATNTITATIAGKT